jgi:hypothetical protein
MAQNQKSYRSILIRSLAAMVLCCIYAFSMLGTSAILLGASSTTALAHGGGGGGHGGGGGGHGGGGGGHGGGGHGFGGGGFRGGGFRGGGFGFGFYPGYYAGYYPYYEDEGGCYLVRQRVMTRYGFDIAGVLNGQEGFGRPAS